MDIQALERQHRRAFQKATAAALGVALVGVAALAYQISLLWLWSATLTGGLVLCAAMFVYLFFARPCRAYLRMLGALQTDKNHTETYRFSSRSTDISMREGVAMQAVHFAMADNDDQDRLLFWPADWPFPALTEGQLLRVRFTGHIIMEIMEHEEKANG